ncbi:MAG: ATP-binding cassette domain-containing protein [Bacteroidetes bacterium]|nr:ATP-binding cassette domain-containing protein [Bacteroidota bacterium]
MSEQILKALMQLFAIIARPASNESDRRTVVETFLRNLLNQELVKEYIEVFDNFYNIYQKKQKEKDKQRRRISASSVRVLKICTEINNQLTQQQKIIVLIQLFEFSRSDGDEITKQELEFIKTVADTFNISMDEYDTIESFVSYSFGKLPSSPDILIIDNNEDFFHPKTKHLVVKSLIGQIRVLNVPSANMYALRYMGDSELYMNGQLLQQDRVFVFNPGSSIRDPKTKPIYYSNIISQFRPELKESRIVYQVKDIEYRFKGGKLGIQKLSFDEESGRLVGIMGASGAGKSTLLFVLNGTNVPTTGQVLINGVDIHRESEDIEGIIGFVSQDDLLIEELTVYQNLYYNAKLCFDNYTKEEVIETVNKVLQNLGLFEIKDMKVGNPLDKKISGGQRKRLNIALELIREPSVLFLDEPTSGLSSRDSENILDLLKELALKGKLVFVVIHQPSSDIFKMFDKLIILDVGGFLIYNGDPIDAIIYFKNKAHHANWNESECTDCGNVNPEQVFNIVESNVLDEYGKVTNTRKISPNEWNNFYKEYIEKIEEKLGSEKEIPKIQFKTPNKVKQFAIFAKRDVLSKLANTQYLVVNFLEAPILAFFLAFLVKYWNDSASNQIGYTLLDNSNLPVYIFMSVIVGIFMGLMVSAEEIIKDRKILKREAFLNLSWTSYLFSKVAVLFIISAIQAFTFVMVGNSIMEIKGMYLAYWIVMFSIWASSNMLGLVISDSFKTVVTIYMLIPFLVIPQIILSGIMVKFEKLNPVVSSPKQIPFYGEFIHARWGYEALAVYQFKNNDYQKQFYIYDKTMSAANYKKLYWYNELKNKTNYLSRAISKDERDNASFSEDLLVLRNEIGKELINNTKVQYKYLDYLYPEKITPEVIQATNTYLELIRKYNIALFNNANDKKDNIISGLMKEDKESFLKTKRQYSNDQLKEFVTNEKEKDRIIEFNGELIQKTNPIYLDPKHPFIKAHFYAPTKRLFGKLYSTFWVNVIVIWIMTVLLYFILHKRLLKRFLDFSEQLSFKFGNQSD